jgi:hypothetical protein
MIGTEISQDVRLYDGSQFDRLNVNNAKIKGDMILSNIAVNDAMLMVGLEIGQDFRPRASQFNSISANNARIHGDIDLSNITVRGALSMTGVEIGQNLKIESSKLAALTVNNGHIKGNVESSGSSVRDNCSMQGTEISQNLALNKSSDFSTVNLVRAHVRGQIDLSGSNFSGRIAAEALRVDGPVILGNGARFEERVDFSSANFGSYLNLIDGNLFSDVDFSGGQLNGRLVLGSWRSGRSANWITKTGAERAPGLFLTNARLNLLPSMSDAWPSGISISGLTYGDLENIDVSNFRAWIQRHETFMNNGYAQQPYEELARVLQNRGQLDDVATVRYLSKEKERENASGIAGVGRWVLKVTIGYGYYTERAVAVALVVVLLGAAMLYVSGQGRAYHMPYGFAYSFDMLLPVIKLREKHYTFDLKGWPRYYFYAHKIAGFILASFLIAGLSGLTK